MKWEFSVIRSLRASANQETLILDDLGEAEWELVSVVHISDFERRFYLKRPVHKKT